MLSSRPFIKSILKINVPRFSCEWPKSIMAEANRTLIISQEGFVACKVALIRMVTWVMALCVDVCVSCWPKCSHTAHNDRFVDTELQHCPEETNCIGLKSVVKQCCWRWSSVRGLTVRSSFNIDDTVCCGKFHRRDKTFVIPPNFKQLKHIGDSSASPLLWSKDIQVSVAFPH